MNARSAATASKIRTRRSDIKIHSMYAVIRGHVPLYLAMTEHSMTQQASLAKPIRVATAVTSSLDLAKALGLEP